MNKYTIYILLFTAALTSCSDNSSVQEDSNMPENNVSVEVSDFVFEAGTRSNYVKDGDRFVFSWEESDAIGVFANKGHQAMFTVAAGEGSNTALVEGGDWTLRPYTEYAAYYPFYTNTPNKEKIVVDLRNDYPLYLVDYMYSEFQQTDGKGNVDFKMKHLNSLIDLNIWMPKFGSCYEISIESNKQKFILKGFYNLAEKSPKITSEYEDSSILLESNFTQDSLLKVTKQFMLLPVDMSTSDLTISILGDEMGIVKKDDPGNREQLYTYVYKPFKGKNFEQEKAYSFEIKPFKYVDLGLTDKDGNSVYWATCNIGATTPEEPGNYFQWGEITPKSSYFDYTKEKNKFYSTATQTYYKYYIKDGITSGKEVDLKELIPDDDAASMNWGEGWRMPSEYDFEQLKTNCSWEKDTLQNGAVVYKVSSKQAGNNNYIYLPAAGKIGNKNGLVINNEEGWYLVRDFYYNNSSYSTLYSRVYQIYKNSNSSSVTARKWNAGREEGVPIRPVYIGK